MTKLLVFLEILELFLPKNYPKEGAPLFDPLLALCEICVSGNAQFDDFDDFGTPNKTLGTTLKAFRKVGPSRHSSSWAGPGRAGRAGPGDVRDF